MRRARRAPLVAALAALALVGSACQLGSISKAGQSTGSATSPPSSASTSTPPTPSTSSDAGATDAPDPALAPFYSQTLAWSACDSGNQCAKLTVPLDYDNPGGQTITLAVAKVPAEQPDQRIGSLVVNPGGPGGSGIQYAESGSDTWGAALRDHFDIVGFDPRGVGQSDPIDCLSDSEEDTYLAGDPDPDTPQEVQEFQQALEKFGAGCIANSGDLASHISTVEAAKDMDILRAALGEATLTYFGASYGTKLGATYAEWFPSKVGRFVLDGAIDPKLSLLQGTEVQAAGFETALRSYVQNCVDQGGCFLGDSVDAGITRIQQFVEGLDQHPLSTQDDSRPLTEGLAFYGIITPLYNRDYWTYLDQGLQSAFQGDGSILEILADAYAERSQDGTYQDNIVEANLAVNCLDDPSFVPADQIPQYIPQLEKDSPTFGKVFAWGLMGCEGYTARTDAKARPIHAKGAAPIVVIGTTRDPATPYSEAVSLAKELDSGVLVSRDGDGHTAYMSGNNCIDDAVESYLVDGDVPQNGLSC